MAVQFSEKSSALNFHSTTTTTSTTAVAKTPFGIEDILYINNNNSKNFHDKNIVKKSLENSDEVNKKSER